MNYNIEIKKSYGPIAFSMPVEKVVELIGNPTTVESIDNALDEATTVLNYDDDDFTLFFEGHNPQLECIDISNPETTLFGEKIFDLGEREIVALMVKNGYCEQDVEDEAWGERRISFPEANIDFFIEDDELTSISIGR